VAVSGVVRPQVGRLAAVFDSYGHPTPYAYVTNEDVTGKEAPVLDRRKPKKPRGAGRRGVKQTEEETGKNATATLTRSI
jgi:hypothetical protein